MTALEGQLSEVQETLAEETKQKLAAQGKVRQAEDELASLREQIEEEEDSRKTLETKIASLSTQVVFIFRPPVYGSNGGTYKMLVMFFLFFQRLISELPRPITAKLRQMIAACVYFIN